MPCHWKGWAVMAAIILPTVCGAMLGEWALDALGYKSAHDLPFLIFFVAAWLSLMAIAKRHSRRVF